MWPYVIALVVGSIVGQFSSSREYSQPTYMILGIATVFLSLAATRLPASEMRFSPKLALRLIAVSLCTLAVLHLYTKFNAHF